jgi:hypothetical protein
VSADLYHTAVHEAGHAIIARVLGMTCGDVSIEADHDSAGHSITADPHVTAGHWERHGNFRDMASVFRGRISRCARINASNP